MSAGLENRLMWKRTLPIRGKSLGHTKRVITHRCVPAGVVALARMEDERSGNTGSPVSGVAHAPTGNPRGAVWACRVADRP